ncbi:MAG TPA: response regulator [Candidatus Paceibacterota bacterium]|nr:response regulator [Candidatus Paceibacterota bacterium]
MHNGTILITEDKDEFRTIYGDRLRFDHYDVLDAKNGVEALEILKNKKVDLIITDINMPEKDGYQLLAEVKADEKLKDIPVIVMTVFDEGEHVKKALELGAADYLVKGNHTPNDVAAKIAAILKSKSAV